MGDREDRLLRELYNQGRPNRDVEPPDFDEIFSRAQSASPVALWQRRAVWMGAAAAVVAVCMAVAVMTGERSSTQGGLDSSTAVAESVEPKWDPMEPVAGTEQLAIDDQERWEELLEFADELWEWESPTDFLL